MRRASDDANLPLINLVFLLMVFFLLVGTLAAPEALQVEPPVSQQLPRDRADADPDGLVIAADGRMALGAETLTDAGLDARLSKWAQENPGTHLRLKADANLEARTLVRILRRLRAAGVEHVRLLASDSTR